MRLTKQSSYAMYALMYCTANEPKLCRVADIAEYYNISETFLFKLIKPLVENGMLETIRGRHGGVRLARPANEITLLDVVQITEDSFIMSDYFEEEGSGEALLGIGELSSALNDALNGFFTILDSHTIAELVGAQHNMHQQLAAS